jgi:hypothetical protein
LIEISILGSIKNTDDIPLEENENTLAETKNKIDKLGAIKPCGNRRT